MNLVPRFRIARPIPLAAAVRGAILDGHLSKGPHVEAFEAAWAENVREHFALAVSSGFAGLHLGLEAMRRQGSTTAILPPVSTCQATLHACRASGLRIRFQDVTGDGFDFLEPLDLGSAPARETVLVTHSLFGRLCEPGEEALAAGVRWLDDAAQSPLTLLHAGRTRRPEATILSFYPTKGCCAIDGGMVLTSDPKLRDMVLDMRSYDHCQAPDEKERYNYRMQNIFAAAGLAALASAGEVIHQRLKLRDAFDALFSGRQGVRPLHADRDGVVPGKYVLLFADPEAARGFHETMQREGVDTGFELAPLTQPIEAFPNAWNLLRTCVSVPFYEALREDEVHAILKAADRALEGV